MNTLDIPNSYGVIANDVPFAESPIGDKFSAFTSEEVLIAISKDNTWEVLGVDIFTINTETKEIIFSDKFLSALSAQLSEYQKKKKEEKTK